MTRLLAFSVLAVAACGDPAADLTDAERAAQLFTAIEGYTSWDQLGAWTTTPVASPSHGGDLVVAYYDEGMVDFGLSGTAPEGATAVKEQYAPSDATTVVALTVMTKVAGYDPEHGDWFWARYKPDGEVEFSGSIGACINCHQGVADTQDWVFGEPAE